MRERLDFTRDCIDPIVQPTPVLRQSLDKTAHARRKHVGALSQHRWQHLAQSRRPSQGDNPALEKKAAELIDDRVALADEPAANSLRDRFGVAVAVLLPFPERLDVLSRDQQNVMPNALSRRPM